MKEQRSASQIMFGFLPEQTVDLRGRIWKVDKWQHPIRERVDEDVLRRELIRQATPWAASGRDGGFVDAMRRNLEIEVVSLNRQSGVLVSPFPQVWICKTCSRLGKTDERPCRCGGRTWSQLHFVGYHDCGRLREPFMPACPVHNQSRIRFPGTSSATEIVIDCPECQRILRQGLGRPPCECGDGHVTFTVHRAAAVYTPRSAVIVNAPRPELVRELQQAGGAKRAVEWVVSGMATRSFLEQGLTADALFAQLRGQGMSEQLARQLVDRAVESGEVVGSDSPDPDIHLSDAAEAEAVAIGTALAESRITISDLEGRVAAESSRGRLYRTEYRQAVTAAGLEGVELLERFPVVTGMYGYTRGDSIPGNARLVPFKRGSRFTIYSDFVLTEALFVRLDPLRVHKWLVRQGMQQLAEAPDARTARLAVLREAAVPFPGEDPPPQPTAGSLVLSLIHSYAHRFIRRASTLAGIERTSLSEYLVPNHLGFFVYAASRGGFVLGGLQALFETELHRLLAEMTNSEHRCPLDPGCARAGSACAACLHLGEPSCRWFNRFLDRQLLHGKDGYFRVD